MAWPALVNMICDPSPRTFVIAMLAGLFCYSALLIAPGLFQTQDVIFGTLWTRKCDMTKYSRTTVHKQLHAFFAPCFVRRIVVVWPLLSYHQAAAARYTASLADMELTMLPIFTTSVLQVLTWWTGRRKKAKKRAWPIYQLGLDNVDENITLLVEGRKTFCKLLLLLQRRSRSTEHR
jgi:hypothetical protein